MNNGQLLWVDDEIELLRGHIMFLERKGYELVTASNGTDAVDLCREHTFDLVLLDEMMPGISGLETLRLIKEIQPATPVVMVTKSEEENIMHQAIGQKIADYLIKPVNPNQILLTLKKNIHSKEIVSEVTQTGYQKNFADISMQIDGCRTWRDFADVYRRLVHWEIELSSADSNMTDMLAMQKAEADSQFARYVRNNYTDWVGRYAPPAVRSGGRQSQAKGRGGDDMPPMSPDVFKTSVFPLLDRGDKVCLVVMDNFRYDQWKALSAEIGDMFDISDNLCMSILPTSTQYARNAVFSGLMPLTISRMYPDLWVDESEEQGKNLNEEALIRTQIERYRRHDTFSYSKINDSSGVEKFMQQYNQLERFDLNVIVVNFIDMLSHSRTESKMVRELAGDESAYRSITLSWFRHNAIGDMFRMLAKSGRTVVLTTDHGSIRVDKAVKIIGDRNTNTNLRYKLGKNLNCDAKDVFTVRDPSKILLPAPNISTSYVFATGATFFAYPNNYNYYVGYYRDTFQHGGISMEEMLVPLVTLRPRRR